MKAISDIIAILLMLIITIGLAGLAYSYISGVFTSRTAVVLSIDAAGSSCSSNSGNITVFVRNDGTTTSGSVSVTISGPNAGTCSPTSGDTIDPGTEKSWTCSRTASYAGYYTIRATTTGSTATGSVYCAS